MITCRRPTLLLALISLLLYVGVANADITITGNVSAASGTAPAYSMVITMDTVTFISYDMALTDPSGNYSVAAPEDQPIIVLAIASSGASESGYQLHEFREEIKQITTGTTDQTIDFAMQPAYEVVFTISADSADSFFVSDMDDNAIYTFALGVGIDGADDVIGINLPIGATRYKMYMVRTLPHAGRIMAHIDNGGAGFGSNTSGHELISFDQQLASDAIDRLQDKLAVFSDDTDEAEFRFDSALTAFAANDFAEAAGHAIVGEEFWSLAKARAGIELYRKGDLTVTVVDKNDNPLPGADVAVSQVDRDFLFGYFDDPTTLSATAMAQARNDGFNFYTAGVYWILSEPTDDNFAWPELDAMMNAASAYTIKGHPLLWFTEYATPEYFQALSGQNLEDEISEHITEIVTRYAGDVYGWDVINEAHGFASMGGLDRATITQITADAVDLVKTIDPDAVTLVNCSFDWFGQSMTAEPITDGLENIKTMSVLSYMQDLVSSGVDYDVFGQQMYNGGCITFFSDLGVGDPVDVDVYDLGEIYRMLDRIGEVGLPAHLTEQSVPSAMAAECPDMGYWRFPWSELTQSEFVTSFYTLVFGTEHFHAATWWNLIDGDSFIKAGGLLNDDGTPKMAYTDLVALFDSWQTDIQDQTDVQGQLQSRVFAGNLSVTASYDTETETKTVAVAEQDAGTIRIQLNVDTPDDDDDVVNDDDIVDDDDSADDDDTIDDDDDTVDDDDVIEDDDDTIADDDDADDDDDVAEGDNDAAGGGDDDDDDGCGC